MLISNSELKQKLDCGQDKQVIKWLNANRVKWWRDAKKRPITTVGEIEKSAELKDDEEVEF